MALDVKKVVHDGVRLTSMVSALWMDCDWSRDNWQECILCDAAGPRIASRLDGSCGKRSGVDDSTWGHHKLGTLLDRLGTIDVQCAEDALAMIDSFSQEGVRHWLKVAGGGKAEILEWVIELEALAPYQVAVECGCFVGYTATRLAFLMKQSGSLACAPKVISIEVDPVHVVVARTVINSARCASTVQVWPGQVRDLLPRLCEDFGNSVVTFVFMDHKGTAFHIDLQAMEAMGQLSPYARVTADNVLKPGAPVYAWMMDQSSQYSSTAWALPEFVQEGTEDWLVVSVRQGLALQEHQELVKNAPRGLERLAWETDKMRHLSERGDVVVGDWEAFASYVRQRFHEYGLEAAPWRGA
eukprot:gnl/MRDRNA2_/MRDRNA2_72347_c0_seq1.p1 gnl/MRDRNA2_/MRDRNA2_72347_c0~~gnl/MRDRNA2_/MRDRNA2_72347_c0_seq1.p1  ORF type:complete len:355 (+),score=63.69 gnl/MRDRNA2_/MRDRNA2_72347_c0_seq1:391-1455(+)